MTQNFFAVCPRGLEALLAQELRALGAKTHSPVAGGAHFSGTLASAYAANLHSRIASRILWRVAEGNYRSEADLYDLARATVWEREFSPDQTLRVDVTAHRSPLRSLQFATLRIKDAIVDRARDRSGSRPSIERTRPDVQVLQGPRRKLSGPANVVNVIRVAAVNEDVAGSHPRCDLIEHGINRRRRHHHPHRTRRFELPDQVVNRRGPGRALARQLLHVVGASVEDYALMSAPQQPANHVCAHAAQPDHPDLHWWLGSSVLDVTADTRGHSSP